MARSAFYCLLLTVWLAAPALAQSIKPVTPEEVAIAFYKVAGLKPSFASWAEDTQRFHEAPFARRDQVRAEEAERLSRAYETYSPATHTLNLSTSAEVELIEEPDPDNSLIVHHRLRWKLSEDNANFFPYEYRDTLFALVPQKIEDFQEAAITAAQAKNIKSRLGSGRAIPILIQLRALKADASKPVSVYGQDVWVIAAGVAGITLWDKSGGLLWEKSAGWYTSPRTESLNQLKTQEAPGY